MNVPCSTVPGSGCAALPTHTPHAAALAPLPHTHSPMTPIAWPSHVQGAHGPWHSHFHGTSIFSPKKAHEAPGRLPPGSSPYLWLSDCRLGVFRAL